MKNRIRKIMAVLLTLTLMSADVGTIAESVIRTLTLPSALQIIEEEAFAGNTSIEKVIVPDGTTEIRSRAFADSSMTELELPDSLTFIAEDAFEGCGEFALTVPENCYAYDRCVELGLIKLDEPDPSVIESAHPYPDEFDYTWTYDAGEGTESVTITFSADTETEEDYDFIYLYTLDDVQVGQYSGTELAGQSVTIDGTGFKLRLTSDEAWDGGNTHYGFKLDSIVPKKAVPLTFDSITAESSAVNAGETIRWTVATTGGKAPVYYDYTVLLGGEEVANGTVEAPNAIEYTPVRAGEYKLSVIARDSADVVLPAQVSEAVTVAPSTAYPESAHPYAANTDQSWVYAAEENVESLTVTFSEETKTQSNYDYIYIYDQYGAQVGKYSGTQLAGQTIEILGSAFTIRLTSNGSTQYHGFTITNIEKYIPGPLTFVSLTVDKTKAKTGDLLTWTMETEGGRRPVTYEYTVTLNGETKYTGSVIRPEQITYVPMTAGDYTLSVVTKDAEGNELPAQTSMVRITERGETAAEWFTIAQTSGNFAKITGYTGTDTAVVIPSVIENYTIESIADRAFQDNTDIISVTLPGTLKEINYRAFRGCTNLRSVSIPDSVTYIGEEAFYNCSKLADVNYPLGWTSASSYGNVFKGTALKTIVIPEGVTSIPAYAFRYCTNFAYFDLPSTIETIGGYAFAGCTGLTSFEIPEKVKVLSNGLLLDCTGLVSVSIPAQATTFEDRVFEGCTHLASVTLPETLERIDYRTFRGCTSLTSVYIPDSVTYIGEEAFYNCSKLADVNYPLGWTSASSYGNAFTGTSLKTMIVPEGVTSIPAHAFRYCTNFTSITLPSTLEVIGDHSFRECTGLSSMHMPEKLISIGDSAFYGCTGLTNVHLNEGLEYLDEDAFMNCTGLTEIYLPDSIHTIMCGAFKGCTNLATMNYPMGWTTTNGYADIFTNTALKTLVIPEGVTSIPQYAFRYCTNFTHFELPDSLQSIPAYAFAGCTGLEKIWIPEGIEPRYDEEGNQTSFVPIASNAFENVSTSALSIHGVSGSYAETFAAEKGYPFVAEAFEYTPATLSGTVTDAAGNPLSGVTVTVYKGPTTNYPFGSITTDSTGAWSMENVKVGSCYTIGFGKEGYNFTPNYETVYNIVENHVYTTVIGNAAPAVLNAEFAVDTVCLDTAASITVTTEEDAGVLVMYAENRDWGRCAVWSVASAQTEVVDGVRVWNVQYTFNTTGDRMLSFAASTDGKTEGDEKTASIKVVEAEMDITVQDFELSRYIAEPEDTISIYGTVSGGDRELQLVTVSLCPDGDVSQGVEIWSSNPGTTEFDLSTIPELVVGQTYSGTDYAVAQVYNRAMLLDAESTHEETGDSSVTMEPGCDYEIVVNAALTDGTTIEEEIISRSVIVQETTVYTGEVATQTSEAGKEFIKEWESLQLVAYDDGQGYLTIGWGHKITGDENFTEYVENDEGVLVPTITEEEADALFDQDLLLRETEGVNVFLSRTGAKVNQQQYDALSSFFFNGNQEATLSSRCMFKLFKENADAIDSIPDWRIYNQLANYYDRTEANTRKGLFSRRLDEARIFTGGGYGRGNWVIEDWVLNGEPVPETWVPSELGEIEYAELEAPEFSYYPEQLYQGANVNVSWEPVEGANYYNLWYRLNTWDEAKYAMCGKESWTNAIDFGDATAMWISLYAMIDGSHHGPGTTIEMKISDLGDLSFSGYILGQTEALDVSSLGTEGFKLGWSCQNAVKYQYKILVLSETPSGNDQASAAEDTYTGTITTEGMTITSDMLKVGKYLKIAVVPVGKNGNLGTWRWIGLKIVDSKPDLAKPVWDSVPDSITSGENFKISWEPVDNAVYYNLWYRVDGTDTMRYKRIEAPACSAKLTAISTVDTTLHVSLYALTNADNHSAGAYKGLSLKGVAGGINYGVWEYQPGDYFTNDKCECAVHTTNIKCKNTYTDGETVIQLGASQCFGFARYAQYEMYGVTSYKNSSSFSKTDGLSYANMNEESLRELITEAGVGAHLRTGSSGSSSWGHSMIITNITEEGFSIIQCNGRNNDQGFSYEACRIGTYTYTWDDYMNDSYGKRGIEYIEYYNK